MGQERQVMDWGEEHEEGEHGQFVFKIRPFSINIKLQVNHLRVDIFKWNL